MQVGFRHSAVEANQTSLPAVKLLNNDGTPKENYEDRISVTSQKFSLQAVTVADEGSYTFSDSNGKVKKKICLNVKGKNVEKHIVFVLFHSVEQTTEWLEVTSNLMSAVSF